MAKRKMVRRKPKGKAQFVRMDDSPKLEDIIVRPPDCNVFENIRGSKIGATAQMAEAAANAEATRVFRALRVRCPKKCPVPRADMSVEKARKNEIVINLPFGNTLKISLGFVCDYEIIYGCFSQSDSEPA